MISRLDGGGEGVNKKCEEVWGKGAGGRVMYIYSAKRYATPYAYSKDFKLVNSPPAAGGSHEASEAASTYNKHET